MTSPLSTTRNPYWKDPKNSTIYTPDYVCRFLYSIIHPVIEPKVILDPAIGRGALIECWRNTCLIVGVDIDRKSERYADEFTCSRFEDIQAWSLSYPDMVICNPPFNGADGRKLYPEVFLRQIIRLFGATVPIVLFAPMGFRLNQRKKSKRWQWVRDNGPEITSIVSLPLDVFDNVKFHSEILMFNIPTVKPHYWLDRNYMVA